MDNARASARWLPKMCIADMTAALLLDSMGTNGKASVYPSKALPAQQAPYYDKAMLSTSEALAKKLAQVMAESRLTGVEVARQCGVTKQAVQGWKSTGRIDKRHLQSLATMSGRPLSWWLDVEESPGAQTIAISAAMENRAPYKLASWPFTTITRQEYQLLSENQRHLVEGFIKGMLSDSTGEKSKAAA